MMGTESLTSATCFLKTVCTQINAGQCGLYQYLTHKYGFDVLFFVMPPLNSKVYDKEKCTYLYIRLFGNKYYISY